METIFELIEYMYNNFEGKRSYWISKYQDLVEETNFDNMKQDESFFVELSYDLEFYVEDIHLRNEDPSYFGEDKLKDLLFSFLLNYSSAIIREEKAT